MVTFELQTIISVGRIGSIREGHERSSLGHSNMRLNMKTLIWN